MCQIHNFHPDPDDGLDFARGVLSAVLLTVGAVFVIVMVGR